MYPQVLEYNHKVNSFIIAVNNDFDPTELAQELKSRFKIEVDLTRNLPDVLIVAPDAPSPSIGIDKVKEIIRFFSFKPFSLSQKTAVIKEAHLLTLPAQNALLKTLEEPPPQSQILLFTHLPDSLIPTVSSRCQLIEPGVRVQIEKADSIALDLISFTLSNPLALTLFRWEKATPNRQSALKFCQTSVLSLQPLLKPQASSNQSQNISPYMGAKLIRELERTANMLKGNTHLRTTIDQLALRINSLGDLS